MSITPFFHVYHKYVFIMNNINKIRLSGTTYSIQDLNATKTVELTQAEYDALSPKDPNVFYIITDAKAGDLSNYYTKTETDGLLDTKLDVTAYTPTDLTNYYTKAETSGSTEISTALASKADTATTYTKTETDNAITSATSTKQDTLVSGTNIKTINNQSIIGEGNITIQGGSGGESCTVDSTTMFYTFSGSYSNYGLDMRVRYVVLDYGQHKTDTPNVSVEVNFRDANYSTFVSKNINLDYSTSSYTLGDISQAEYIDVTYDSTIEDFKIAVATAYTSTVFIDYVNFSVGKIKVPFYTISSGSPCTAIENDIPTAISELGNIMIKGLKEVKISSQQNAIYIYNETLDGNSSKRKIKLDEIDGSSSTLKPDIYVGLGTSGWTEINFSDFCIIDYLKATKYRVTYNNSELDSYSMGLQLTVEYAGNEINDSVIFDETYQPSLQTQDVFSAATVDWNASTRELVITYPETVELNGKQESVNISKINSDGCNFGQAITKLESYGEEKQALKPYVKETRAALGGKQDTLVSGTNIKTINNQSILGEGNITIEGGSGGGKAVSAGTNISITTGDTADTINCTLPISSGTGKYSVMFGQTNSTSDASGSKTITGGQWSKAFSEGTVSIGQMNEARGAWSWAIGNMTRTNGKASFACGDYTSANYNFSFSEGTNTTANTKASHAAGSYTNTKNRSEFSIGEYNNSVSASTTFGDSGNTLFSVGNGTADNARHNAFEIRQNGDIYISKDGQDVKLQDQLGGGGGSSYTAGDGIDITNDVISVTGKVDTSAITTTITSSSTDAQVPSAKAVYDMVGNINTILESI